MYGRLLITCLVALSAWAASSLMRQRQVASANRASRGEPGRAGKPSIVYFWSDACSVCKRVQRPVLDELVAELGAERLALTAYCVDEAPDFAGKWGVRTLPTTFVLDPAGHVRHVNNGLATARRLREQLEPFC